MENKCRQVTQAVCLTALSALKNLGQLLCRNNSLLSSYMNIIPLIHLLRLNGLRVYFPMLVIGIC